MFVFLVAALLTDMTVEEKSQTGLSKLTCEERVALQDWIDAHYLAKNGKKKLSGPVLQDNLNNGRLIRLTGGSAWEIHPADTPITQGWITAVEIKIEKSSDADYPYKLTNTLTGSTVRAKTGE